MNLSDLKKIRIKNPGKRVGRGYSSGKGGHTIGKGSKGQKSRAGNAKPWFGFEGGQVPLFKRLPKINGFKRPFAAKTLTLNIMRLNDIEEGTKITPSYLMKSGILRSIGKSKVKIVGKGKLETKLHLKGFLYSSGALEAVKKSGSKILE